MFITYSIVWVDPENPSLILDEFGTNYKWLEDARLDYEHLISNSPNNDDGLDWIPRITKVTEEFV